MNTTPTEDIALGAEIVVQGRVASTWPRTRRHDAGAIICTANDDVQVHTSTSTDLLPAVGSTVRTTVRVTDQLITESGQRRHFFTEADTTHPDGRVPWEVIAPNPEGHSTRGAENREVAAQRFLQDALDSDMTPRDGGRLADVLRAALNQLSD